MTGPAGAPRLAPATTAQQATRDGVKLLRDSVWSQDLLRVICLKSANLTFRVTVRPLAPLLWMRCQTPRPPLPALATARPPRSGPRRRCAPAIDLRMRSGRTGARRYRGRRDKVVRRLAEIPAQRSPGPGRAGQPPHGFPGVPCAPLSAARHHRNVAPGGRRQNRPSRGRITNRPFGLS